MERDISDLKVVYDGICSVKALVKTIQGWLTQNGFEDLYGGKDKFLESFYFEKITSQGKEVWIWWRVKKKTDNPYIFYNMIIDFKITGMNDVEIVYKGNKVKANKAKVEIKMASKMIFDEEKRLEGSFMGKLVNMTKFVGISFEKLYKTQVDNASGELKSLTNELHNMIKTYLEMKTFMPKVEPFEPSRGLM